MTNSGKTTTSISYIKFSKDEENKRPVFCEKLNKQKGWVNWGEDNNYPEFLLSLYENSSV